ncbi:MAG: TIGR00730 family Rossman fold protein [Patescibacteria group bacterium]|nr:TIGR00730 family Rossman fold protein [Patescibacteria group bacterium]
MTKVKRTIKRIVKIPALPGPGPEKKISLQKMSDITWRIFRIMSEFVDGFEFLSKLKKEVTIFGSARLDHQNHWCKEAEKLGHILVRHGFTVITGGGPGIMEAANKGAYGVNPDKSVGINIQLPTEQRVNPYVKKAAGFYYFFTRKVMLAASAQSYIFFPGGYGTADEFLEILELVQTGKMQKTPIILMGKDFWLPLISWFEKTMAKKYKTINPKDIKLFHVVDTAEQAFKYIKGSHERTIF